MLQDPENVEEWEEPVRAKNLDEARKLCRIKAEKQPLTEVINVSQETTTPRNGTYRFVCWFRSERINGHDSDDDS